MKHDGFGTHEEHMDDLDEEEEYVSPPATKMRFESEHGNSLEIPSSDLWRHLLYSPPGVVFGVGISYNEDDVFDLTEWAREESVDHVVCSSDASLFGTLCLLYLPLIELRRIDAEEEQFVWDKRINNERAVLTEDQIELVSKIGVFFRDGGKIRVLRGENV